MRAKLSRACILVFLSFLFGFPGAVHPDSLREAKADIKNLRFDGAVEKLVSAVKLAKGKKKQEALFLLAGLKRSSSEAEIIYQEVIGIDPEGKWAMRAFLELAKIQYAIGDYKAAYDLLESANSCEGPAESRFFQGLSAIMLRDYRRAEECLSRVRSGKYKVWASLSLAEIESARNNPSGACERYRVMANARINPVALYRYAECLERGGDRDGAASRFEEIIENFRSAPEAVLAGEKLKILNQRAAGGRLAEEGTVRASRPSSGFTIQFGAFYDRRNAIKLRARVKGLLAEVRIDSDLLGSREIHRVRYGYFKTREEALRKAEELREIIGEEYTVMTIP